MQRINQSILKIILVIPFFLLIAGLISAWCTPSTHWEANIYLETPLLFWVGIFSSYLVGIGFILYARLYHPLPKYIHWIAWSLIIFAAVSLLFLTTIRWYHILGITGDVGTHMGNLKRLLETGTITDTYYPGIYWEPAAFSLLTGIGIEKTLSLFPMFMICLSTLGISLLAHRVLPNKSMAYIATIIALLLPIGSSLIFFRTQDTLFVGMTIADIGLLPLFLLMILTLLNGSNKILIPLLIMNLAIVFYHPNVTIVCLVIYVSLILFSGLPHFGKKYVSSSSLKQLLVLFFSLVGMTILWVWRFYGHMMISGFLKIFEAVNAEERGMARSVSLLDAAATYGFGIDTAIRVCAINLIIYGFLLLAGIIFIMKYWNNKQYFLMKALLVCAAVLGAVVVIAMLGNFGAQPSRFMRVMYITGILSVGFTIYNLFKHLSNSGARKRFLHVSSIFVLIAAICFVSVLSFWSSPNTLSHSFQTEDTSYTAAETLLPRIDYSNAETTGIHFTGLQRYVGALYGSAYNVGSYEGGTYHMISTSKGGTDYADGVPYHFGYDTGSTSLADAYVDGTYIFIVDKDKRFYQAYYPEMIQFRWTPQDFKQLSVDKGLDSVYNNGGMEMYVVK